MKRIIIVAIVSLAACLSCGSGAGDKTVEVDEVITFSADTDIPIASVVDSISYLPLETNDKSMFSNVDKMIIRDDRIYIGDYSSSVVVVFDMEGNHLLTIDKRGRGPGEYIRLSAFTVDDRYMYLMDNDSGMVRKYDLSGAFVEQRELSLLAWDIAVFDDGNLMFATAPLDVRGFVSEQSLHRIFITDAELNIHTSLFEYQKREVDPVGKLNYLVENDEQIIFHSMGSDVITIFSKADRSDVRHVAVDFGRNRIPDRHRSNMDEIDRLGYNYIQSTPVFAGDYISLDINVGDYLETFLYDRANRRLLAQHEGDVVIIPYPNASSAGKYYVAMSSSTQYRALVADGFPKASPNAERHIADEGSALIIYHMGI